MEDSMEERYVILVNTGGRLESRILDRLHEYNQELRLDEEDWRLCPTFHTVHCLPSILPEDTPVPFAVILNTTNEDEANQTMVSAWEKQVELWIRGG